MMLIKKNKHMPDFMSLLDIGCVCLLSQVEKCPENIEDSFCRKIDGNTLKIKDFRSPWEKGKKVINGHPVSDNDCESILSLKGISIDLYNEETKEEILGKYRTTFSFNRRKAMYAIFRFQPSAGKVRYSPYDGDTSHHDFYKSDTFSIEQVVTIKTGNILEDRDER
jgi:hypothetical protein